MSKGLPMNNNDDSFLTSLLQYHTRFIDQQFVENIISKIKAKNKLRIRLLIMAILISVSIATLLIINIGDKPEFLNMLPSLSPYIITLLLLSILGFGAWLTSEDF